LHLGSGMAALLPATIDLLHAALMAAWVLGIPLLFARRWPRVTGAYAAYAIVFIVVNQLSFLFLGECFLTTLARAAWLRAGSAPSSEWFTVRVAAAVFRMVPSHVAVRRVSEALIFVSAVGVAFRVLRDRRRPALRAHEGRSAAVDGMRRIRSRG